MFCNVYIVSSFYPYLILFVQYPSHIKCNSLPSLCKPMNLPHLPQLTMVSQPQPTFVWNNWIYNLLSFHKRLVSFDFHLWKISRNLIKKTTPEDIETTLQTDCIFISHLARFSAVFICYLQSLWVNTCCSFHTLWLHSILVHRHFMQIIWLENPYTNVSLWDVDLQKIWVFI